MLNYEERTACYPPTGPAAAFLWPKLSSQVGVISLQTLYEVLAGSHGGNVDYFWRRSLLLLEVSAAICALISRGQDHRIRVELARSSSKANDVKNGTLI